MIKKEGEGKEEEEDEGEKEDELVLREAKFTLKTNGGDCRNVLKQSLRKLFAEVLETSTSEGGGGGGHFGRGRFARAGGPERRDRRVHRGEPQRSHDEFCVE